MKILVNIDANGNFNATHVGDRQLILKVIKEIDGGQYFSEITKEYNIEFKDNLSEYCCQEWNEILSKFIHKGILEYVTLTDNVPTLCACSNK